MRLVLSFVVAPEGWKGAREVKSCVIETDRDGHPVASSLAAASSYVGEHVNAEARRHSLRQETI